MNKNIGANDKCGTVRKAKISRKDAVHWSSPLKQWVSILKILKIFRKEATQNAIWFFHSTGRDYDGRADVPCGPAVSARDSLAFVPRNLRVHFGSVIETSRRLRRIHSVDLLKMPDVNSLRRTVNG